MGLVSGLLLLPLAPVRATTWVTDVLIDAAEKELYGPAAIRTRLADLNRRYDDGEVGEAEFEAEEDRLLELLERSRAVGNAGFESRRDG